MADEGKVIVKEITPPALEKIIALIADVAKDEKKPSGDYHLRVFVEGGGCAGFQYGLAIEDTTKKQDGDHIQQFGDLEVRVDPMSSLYLSGSRIEYTDGLMGAGFHVINPNATGGCGCGHSFSV